MNPAQTQQEKHLASVWRALYEGHAATAEDFRDVLVDLALASGYFEVHPAGVSSDILQYQNGARTVFARILFLLDVENAEASAALRRQALAQLMSEE